MGGLGSTRVTGRVDGHAAQAGSRCGKGSPLFAEMTINAPKSSVDRRRPPLRRSPRRLDAGPAGRLWRRFGAGSAQHSVTRVGPRGAQEVVPVEHMQVVGITHRTSRAGDPHRHIHMQIGTRVWAAGKWRALDHRGAVQAARRDPRARHRRDRRAPRSLPQTLAEHGLTLDPVTGEVTELEPFNARNEQAVGDRSRKQPRPPRSRVGSRASWREIGPGRRRTDAGHGVGVPAAREEARTTSKNEQWWLTGTHARPATTPSSLNPRPAQPAGIAG